jgi:hypothetical protein
MKNSYQILVAAAMAGTQFIPAGCRHNAVQKIPDRPNIVWIVCEDMHPISGCYGDTSPTVQIAAAELLCHLVGTGKGIVKP